jgi:hypothetical protein
MLSMLDPSNNYGRDMEKMQMIITYTELSEITDDMEKL